MSYYFHFNKDEELSKFKRHGSLLGKCIVNQGKYFTGDGSFRDLEGNYRITGRVDDVVIVSGHNLGTAPIENIINEHSNVVESAIVGYPHDSSCRNYGRIIGEIIKY